MSSLSQATRLAVLEKRHGGDDEPEVRFILHPDPCPEAGPDGTCPCAVFTLDLGATLEDDAE
jgi:hypothetical protein